MDRPIEYKQTDPQVERMSEAKTVGEGVKFERIRRITGYLVGTTDRFNDAKQHEEHDRMKHGMQPECCS